MRMQIRMCPRIGSGVVEPWDASSGQDPALFNGEKDQDPRRQDAAHQGGFLI
jgi:hypothetical protein